MKWSKSSIPDGIGLLVFSLFLVIGGRMVSLKNWKDGISPRAFPYFLAGCISILGLALIFFGTHELKKQDFVSTPQDTEVSMKKSYRLFCKPSVIPPPLFMVFMIIVYQLLWKSVGFLIVTPIFLWISLYALGSHPKKAVIITLGITIVIYMAFTYGFKVNLPGGLLYGIL